MGVWECVNMHLWLSAWIYWINKCMRSMCVRTYRYLLYMRGCICCICEQILHRHRSLQFHITIRLIKDINNQTANNLAHVQFTHKQTTTDVKVFTRTRCTVQVVSETWDWKTIAWWLMYYWFLVQLQCSAYCCCWWWWQSRLCCHRHFISVSIACASSPLFTLCGLCVFCHQVKIWTDFNS